jgi:hypothetical protein
MEHHVDGTSVRGLLVTMFFWTVSHITASDIATYCTIASALVTIVVNVHRLGKEIKKSKSDEKRSDNPR